MTATESSRLADGQAYHEPCTFRVGDPGNRREHPGERELVISRGNISDLVRLLPTELADLARVAHDAAYTGRKTVEWASGNTPGELERSATDAAADFYGHRHVHADPHWCAEKITGSARRLHDFPPEHRYCAQVTVRELAGDDPYADYRP